MTPISEIVCAVLLWCGVIGLCITAHYFGAHLTACEIDPDYYAAAMARIKRETAQQTLFT